MRIFLNLFPKFVTFTLYLAIHCVFFLYHYCMYAKKVVSLHSKYNAKPIGS